MILGDKFLTDWRNYSSNKRDFLLELKTYLKSITGTNGYFKKLCQILFLIANGKEKKNLQNILDEKIKRLKQMENKEKFLQDAKNRKLKLTKQVEKIDLMLNDEKILIKQFVKKNEQLEADKRISSLRIFRNMMQKDRETYLNEISEIACLIKPNHFLKEKHELEEYQEIANNKKSIQEEMIALQKEFLKFMNKKISHLTTRDELVDMLYELRYYKTIFIDAQTCIKDVEILNNAIDKIMKKLITIACKSGIIKIISMDIALNYEIIKYALDTKIINLEGIKLYLEQDENYLMIKVYDNEIFEKQGRKKINASHKKLEVKYKKMIKIFN